MKRAACSGADFSRPHVGASVDLGLFLRMAIDYGYTTGVDVSIAEAKNRLTQLIRAVEQGEQVIITRNGKPVAQITPPPPARRQVRLGGMKGRIQLLPGWDQPIDLDSFLEGDL